MAQNATASASTMFEDDVNNLGDPTGFLPWLGVAGAWLCFGSFAVPMKWKSVVDVEVHPLVFQCYKTVWTFITSHLVLFFEPYQFSWWGIVSGLLWVPAGIAAVVAVQNVGIAYGQAIWQVTIILTSFVWGFAIMRDEQVHTWWGTAASLVCLVVGVVGMTISFNLSKDGETECDTLDALVADPSPGSSEASSIPVNNLENKPSAPAAVDAPAETASDPERQKCSLTNPSRSLAASGSVLSRSMVRSQISQSYSIAGVGTPRRHTRSSVSDIRYAADDLVSGSAKASVGLGISAALFNGMWGGSNLVPSKYAPVHGIHFVISFASGALIVNVLLVLLYALWIKLWRGGQLPPPHFRTMALPGFISGTLWSAGNFCSLYVVNTIGQGIGYSLIQSSVICSGLWGIFLYREMSGRPLIYWSFFCAVCSGGVVLLALEKK